MSGLFSTLNTGLRGINTQQTAIDVTNHNVANANTDGYTRQRAQMVASRPEGMPSMNNAVSVGQIGTGSEVNQINRVRDEFIDYQVRQATSVFGLNDVQQKSYSEIEGIFNEPSEDALSKDFTTFFNNWSELSQTPEDPSARNVVVTQAATMADDIRTTYKNIKDIKDNTNTSIQAKIFSVNQKLADLDEVNQQIRRVTQAGETGNDLLDKRDVILDDLSKEFGITIDKDNYSSINLLSSDNTGAYTAKFINATDIKDEDRLSYVNNITQAKDASGKPIAGEYTISYYVNGDKTGNNTLKSVTLTGVSDTQLNQLQNGRVVVTDLNGNLLSQDGTAYTNSNLYTDTDNNGVNDATIDVSASSSTNGVYIFSPAAGEISGYKKINDTVDRYMTKLDNMAKALAWTVNAVQSQANSAVAADGTINDKTPFFVNKDKAESLYDITNKDHLDITAYYTDANGNVNNSVEDSITAANISVNKELIDSPTELRVNKDPVTNGKGDGKVATAISDIKDALVMIQNVGATINTRSQLVSIDSNTGMITNNANGSTVPKFFKDIIDTLGTESDSAQSNATNQQALLNIFNQSKNSTSGVNLDEEMANLIQYQHAYSASAKVISTVDELLDVVVNGLKK